MNRKQKAVQAARMLLRTAEKALLSTHSKSKQGFPFGSVTTFMADEQGQPIIYVSDLAQHTKNIKANPKMSLLVSSDNPDDINAGARLTLLGEAQLITGSQANEYAVDFYQRFPQSKQYESTHDFAFYRLEVEHIRYIGGFGEIYWLAADQFLLPAPDWKKQIKPAIDHMNEDHSDALQLILEHQGNKPSADIKMTHLYADGFVMQVNAKYNHYIGFDELIKSGQDIRPIFVSLTQQARSAKKKSA